MRYLLWMTQVEWCFDAGGCSDHARAKISFYSDQSSPRKRTFKFSNSLVESEDFLPTVSGFWESQAPLYISTSASYLFSKKLKTLKKEIRKLGRKCLSQIEKRTKEALEELCKKQEANYAKPSPALLREEITAYENWVCLADAEEKYLKQKSKIHWLKVGDKNNKFFHNAIKARKQNNSIKEILCRDGTTAYTKEEIKEEAESFLRIS